MTYNFINCFSSSVASIYHFGLRPSPDHSSPVFIPIFCRQFSFRLFGLFGLFGVCFHFGFRAIRKRQVLWFNFIQRYFCINIVNNIWKLNLSLFFSLNLKFFYLILSFFLKLFYFIFNLSVSWSWSFSFFFSFFFSISISFSCDWGCGRGNLNLDLDLT